MPVIAWIVSGLVWVFKNRIGLFIAQALAWAGLTYGTTKVVIEPAIDMLENYMLAMGDGGDLGAAAFQWIGVLKFDVACTMMMSAYVTKLGVQSAKVFLMKQGA